MDTLKDLWKKDPGLVVSGGIHALAFLFLIANFTWPPKLEEAVESVPVEMITTSDLNQIMNGEKTAKPMDKPQRRVDKLAELEDHQTAPPLAEAKKNTPPQPSPEKANDDPGDDDKPTVKSAAVPPPPTPPVRPVETKPVPQPPARPVEKAEAPTPPPKPDPVKPPPPDAEAVEAKPPPRPKDEPKPIETKVEKKVVKHTPKPVPRPVEEAKEVPDAPTPPQRPDKPDLRKRTLDQVAKLLDTLKSDKPPTKQRSGNEARDAKHSDFSFDKITALLDHDAPQRKASTGKALAQLASLGSPTAHAEKMSPSMAAAIDGWLIDHYRGCWSYFGLGATQDYVPKVHVRMAPDGTLIGQPSLVNAPSDPNLRSLADSAVRAVNRCNPMPVPDWFKAHYEAWRDRTVRFDPKEMS